MTKVVEVLRGAPALAGLGREHLSAIERAARVVECAPGEMICPSADEDRRLFVLLEGELEVLVALREGERCGGEVRSKLDQPGEVLGWALLVKRDRLATTARCVTPSRLLSIDLARLPARTGLALATSVAIHLYGRMRQLGLCPRRTSGLDAN